MPHRSESRYNPESRYRSAPLDDTSIAAAAAQDLTYALVDTTDRPAFEAWLQSHLRGFHSPDYSRAFMDANVAGYAYRRTTGVWDGDEPEPVATVNSWPAELTVPGERIVTAWAISAVTVAPTHRRKGIATALVEGELRTAAAQGIPLAILTVSESSIYGRWGFAPGTFATTMRIDTRRARWTGPSPTGRVRFVGREEAREIVATLHDTARRATPGQIDVWPLNWDQLLGFAGDDPDVAKNVRAVRYLDDAGVTRGLAVYRVSGGEADFTTHTLAVEHLVTETDDAYSALWRFLLEVDLVGTVTAELRGPDEPLLWQVSDRRGVVQKPADHLWLRILDVGAALQARRWTGPARIALTVTDDLGYASGAYLLDIGADGLGSVTALDEVPQDVASLALPVTSLSALYLGGVSAEALASAGLITELHPGSLAIADSAFHSAVRPWLDVWF